MSDIYIQRMNRRQIHVVDHGHPLFPLCPEAATVVFSTMGAAEAFARGLAPYYWHRHWRGWRLALKGSREGLLAGIVSQGAEGFDVYDIRARCWVACRLPTLAMAQEAALSLVEERV
jgi:hypothetical protein